MSIDEIIRKARKLAGNGDYDGAEAAYWAASEIDAEDPRVHNGLGTISLTRDHDGLMAQCWYGLAAFYDAKNPETWNNIATVLYEAKQFPLALSAAALALKLDGDNINALAILADSLDGLGSCGLANGKWRQLVRRRSAEDPDWDKYAEWRLANQPKGRTREEIISSLKAVRDEGFGLIPRKGTSRNDPKAPTACQDQTPAPTR
jgi:tetratricopeptide (TPR) repeat protein